MRFVENDERIVESTPAHIRQRRNLDDIFVDEFLIHVETKNFLQGIIQRSKIRIDFFAHIARQESQPFARFDRRTRQNNFLYIFNSEMIASERDGKKSFAGAGGSDAQRDDIIAHRVDVILLSDGFGVNVRTLRRHQNRLECVLSVNLCSQLKTITPIQKIFFQWQVDVDEKINCFADDCIVDRISDRELFYRLRFKTRRRRFTSARMRQDRRSFFDIGDQKTDLKIPTTI